MATQSSILAWEILQTEEPGGLQSMGLQRISHDMVTKQYRVCVCVCVCIIGYLYIAHINTYIGLISV